MEKLLTILSYVSIILFLVYIVLSYIAYTNYSRLDRIMDKIFYGREATFFNYTVQWFIAALIGFIYLVL